jgi:signal transduction histidine kinase
VRTLHEDKAGTLWIGTAAGLCRWRDGKVSTFTTAQGLANDTISQILEDDSGNLWLGSNQGIMRVAKGDLEAVAAGRKSALEVFQCGRGEGMLSLECSGGFYPAGLKTRDGKMWFPTASGLVAVDPSQMKLASNPLPPPVYIEEVVADGNTVMSAPLLRKDQTTRGSRTAIRLPQGVHRMEVRYTALSLTAPERVRFRHRMEGLDSDWTEAQRERSAVYTKLPPGTYHFQVMGSNNDGLWSEQGATLSFIVPPFFWQTWWFLGLTLALGVSGVAGAARWVAKKQLQRKLEWLERERAVERERSRIARDIHDDLGASLTRITLLSESARDGHAGGAAVYGEIDQIYSTARDLTRSMDEIVWAVNPEHDTLDSVVTYLAKFAQDFLKTAGVRCRLDIPVNVPGLSLTSEIRHGIFLAFKEALHNTLKHSAATEVWIRLVMGEGAFTISIEDNGRGFDTAIGPGGNGSGGSGNGNGRIMTGHGLRNLRERLAAMGGRCEVDSRAGEGTRVKFIVPGDVSKKTRSGNGVIKSDDMSRKPGGAIL